MMVFSLVLSSVVMLALTVLIDMGLGGAVREGDVSKAKTGLVLMIISFPLGGLLVFLAGTVVGAAQ